MNVKYYCDFAGADGAQYRFEILCNETVTSGKIEATSSPITLEYPDVMKLEAVQSSGAKIGIISKSIFQFLDLHTDDMQYYLVRFYKAGALYWLGWLDAELYSENLAAAPPYPIEFSASDFNILERLRYKKDDGTKYNDIARLLTQLMRCLSLLGLPLQKLYIGCSTSAEGVSLAVNETLLHKLYVQSSNFYDEDGEPMDCREVITSLLEPFGLTMVQRDGSIYIYDYNTVKAGGVMKCFDYATLNYIGDTLVDVVLGDLPDIGFASTEASLGFEEMINNVEITSSPYVELPFVDKKIDKSSLKDEDKTGEVDNNDYTKTTYKAAIDWPWNQFVLLQSKKQDSTIIGARLPYLGLPANNSAAWVMPNKLMEIDMTNDYIFGSDSGYMLNIKLDAYFNGKADPFNTDEKADDSEQTRMGVLRCNLYLIDNTGKIIKYYRAIGNELGRQEHEWKVKTGTDELAEQGMFSLVYADKNIYTSRLLNKWVTNSNIDRPLSIVSFAGSIDELNLSSGCNIPLPYGISGFLRLEILDHVKMYSPYDPAAVAYPASKVKDFIINKLVVSIVDKNGKEVAPIDYEFKSYINKKVASDFEKKELKVVSCNEDMMPVGKGCLLKFIDNHYELQLKYTRSGQTDILERLLMCSIHSNYTAKNKVISVDLTSTENPMLKCCTYNGVGFASPMLVAGCSIDFQNSITRVKAVDFSDDVEKLSNISYNE